MSGIPLQYVGKIPTAFLFDSMVTFLHNSPLMHHKDYSLAHVRVLVIDDEPACRSTVTAFLESTGAAVVPVASAEDALTHLAAESCDAVITDIRLEGMDGIEFLKRIRNEGNEVPVIIMTGFASLQSAISALQLGADDYLIKPISKPESIVRATRNAIDRFHLRTQNAMLRLQLEESELSFQTVFDHTEDMIFSFTLSPDNEPSTMEQTNRPAIDALGYPETTLRKMTLLDAVASSHKREAVHHISTCGASPVPFDTVLVAADGRQIPVEISCHILRSPSRTMVLAIARNISYRVEVEAKFANVLEEERRRMARELHDVVCQDLASIDILAKTACGDRNSREMTAIHLAATSALTSARQLCRGLLPSFEDGTDLVVTTEDLLRRHKERHGIDYAIDMVPAVRVGGENGLLHLFRIIQEAVNNTLKHADATHIGIDLTLDGMDSYRLTISDNGTGVRADNGQNDGVGMLIMRQRARIIGASLSISGNDAGTTVECVWQNTEEHHA